MNRETQVFERAWIYFERKAPELDFKTILDTAIAAAGVNHYSELTYEQWAEVNRLQQKLIQQNEVKIVPSHTTDQAQAMMMEEWRSKSRNYGHGMD